MRYVIGAAAFFVPFLIVIAIGASGAGGTATRTRLGQAAIGELRDFASSREALLDRYVAMPGSPGSAGMPHLALERFDRRGCDAGGQPWYRLALKPAEPACGLLRRAASGAPPSTIDGVRPNLVLPLTPVWAYWEMASPPPKSP
jgi:hypothetical protein